MYWWHTAEDTFDKIDFDGLMRDGAVVRSLLCGLLNEEMLPADFSEYFHTWTGYLEPLKNSSKYGEEIEEIQKQLKTVIQLCVDLEKKWNTEEQEKGEPIHLEDHNRLCRITGGVISRLMHSSGSAYEQDTSFAYGPLHLLGASAKGDFQKGPKDWELFYHTTFIRQRNRMVTELRKLQKQIEQEF